MPAIRQKRSRAKTFALTFILVTFYALIILALRRPANPAVFVAISLFMAVCCAGMLGFAETRLRKGTFINGFSFAFVLCLPFFVMMGMSGRGLAPATFAAIALGAAMVIGLMNGLAEALLGAPPSKDVD